VVKKEKPHGELVTMGLVKRIRRRPTLPHSHPCSTIGAEELNFRVRNGNGWILFAVVTENQKPDDRGQKPEDGCLRQEATTISVLESSVREGENCFYISPRAITVKLDNQIVEYAEPGQIKKASRRGSGHISAGAERQAHLSSVLCLLTTAMDKPHG
jgi:hypothetical protein